MGPVNWMVNRRAWSPAGSEAAVEIIPPEAVHSARSFHRQIPGYRISPLKCLHNLASMMGVGGIWVKDESVRLELNSFKVLGGSFAVYNLLRGRLGMEGDVPLPVLTSQESIGKLGPITFAAATDGNHGRGVAWAANKLGFSSVIYVHRETAQARIGSIESYGANVQVIDGTYDDAVNQLKADAQKHDWVVIADTSWDGYEEIPTWVMQGYTTLFSEAQEQLAAQGIVKPSHIFLQAGVGALAASGTAFYRGLFGQDGPISIVVEPSKAACLLGSAREGDGEPHKFEGELETIMAGLACGEPSPIAWRILWDCAHVFVSCPDYVAAKGMRVYGVPLAGDPFVVSGESGAVTLGALMFALERPELKPLREALDLGPNSQVLLINTEGNTDPEEFRRVLWDGALPVPEEYRTEEGKK